MTQYTANPPTDANEEWRPLLGFDKPYAISDVGRIMRLEDGKRGVTRAGQYLKPYVTPLGYYYVSLMCGGTRKKYTIHALIARAFIGPRPDGCEVNHIDKNKGNNTPSNLEYVTRRQNLLYSYDDIYCSWARPRKVTDAQIADMAALYKSGRYLQREIASMYGISQSRVSVLIRAA